MERKGSKTAAGGRSRLGDAEDAARTKCRPGFRLIFNTAFLVLAQRVVFLVLEGIEARRDGQGEEAVFPGTGYRRVKNFYGAHYSPRWPPSFPSSAFSSLSFPAGFAAQSRCTKPVLHFFLLTVELHDALKVHSQQLNRFYWPQLFADAIRDRCNHSFRSFTSVGLFHPTICTFICRCRNGLCLVADATLSVSIRASEIARLRRIFGIMSPINSRNFTSAECRKIQRAIDSAGKLLRPANSRGGNRSRNYKFTLIY